MYSGSGSDDGRGSTKSGRDLKFFARDYHSARAAPFFLDPPLNHKFNISFQAKMTLHGHITLGPGEDACVTLVLLNGGGNDSLKLMP